MPELPEILLYLHALEPRIVGRLLADRALSSKTSAICFFFWTPIQVENRKHCSLPTV
ncbi:MAG: hypothetical protein ACT443_08645 [Gemmatimonadota bacterium]